MEPQQFQANDLRLLLKSMGISVQRDPQTRPARKPRPPNATLLIGLGFIFVFFMMMRAPNVMCDFVQMIRTGAIALMMISSTMIFADLCLSNEHERIEAAPPPADGTSRPTKSPSGPTDAATRWSHWTAPPRSRAVVHRALGATRGSPSGRHRGAFRAASPNLADTVGNGNRTKLERQ